MNEMSMDLPLLAPDSDYREPAPVVLDENDVDFDRMMVMMPERGQHNGTFYIDKDKAKEIYGVSSGAILKSNPPAAK